MPKTKPTKTESLRIELQDTERKYLERVADSVAFRNYMKPITDLATDNTIFYVVLLPILTLISGWIGLKWIQQTDLYNDAKEMFDDWNLQYQAAREAGIVPAVTTVVLSRLPGLPSTVGDILQQRPGEAANWLNIAGNERIDELHDLADITPGPVDDWVVGLIESIWNL